MTFRLAFWTLAISYTSVLLLEQASFRSPGELVFGASMGAILGLVFASAFARRAKGRRMQNAILK